MKSPVEILVAGYLDGTATTAEQSELDALLVSDPSVATRLADLGRIDSLLAQRFSSEEREQQANRLLSSLFPPRSLDRVAEEIEAGPSPVPFAPANRRSPVLGFLANISRHVPGGEFTIGSLLLLVIVAAFWGLSQAILYPRLGGQDLAELSAGDEEETVATIRETSKVEWSPKKSEIPNPKSEIAANQPLSITSGLIELQLTGGTTLLIEGPANWKVTGENSATLTHGKLVAKVPEQAIGFTLDTPNSRIIDLGTEFGVEVQPGGHSEITVLKGKVRALTGTSSAVTLTAGSSVRIDPGSAPRKIATDPHKFAHLSQFPNVTSPPRFVEFELVNGDAALNWNDPVCWSSGKAPESNAIYRVGHRHHMIRTPETESPAAFGGGSLILQKGSLMVLKHNGRAHVPHLQIEGARIIPGSKKFAKRAFELSGRLSVMAASLISLSGETIVLSMDIQGDAGLNVLGPGKLLLSSDGHKFHGDWKIESAHVVAQSLSSLGGGDFLVRAGGVLETQYDLDNPKSSLTLEPGAKFIAERNCTLRSITVAGKALEPGEYRLATLAEKYPAYISGRAKSIRILTTPEPEHRNRRAD